MGKGRTENNTNRQVTFCNGLHIKKAYEFSAAVLCNAVVALITVVFSRRGRLHECANNRAHNMSSPGRLDNHECTSNSDKKMVKLLIVTAIFLGTHLAPVNSSSRTSAYWEFYCAGGNFTPSSTYSRSLDKIAAELPKKVASSPLLFAGSQIGDVHALAQCRQDFTASACKMCIAGGLRDAVKVLCESRKGAVVFLEICTVAYSHQELLQYPTGNELDITASKRDFLPIILETEPFNTSVRELARAVARMAATSPAHFGTGEKKVVQAQYRLTIYALGQCMPNLSDKDCEICLTDLVYAIDIGVDMTTGRVAKVWCSYRFSLYKFFRGKPALVIPAEGLPQKGGKRHHNDDKTTIAWALVVVLFTLLLLSVVAGLVYWWRNRNQQKKSLGKEVQCIGKEVQCTGKAVEVVPCPSALEAFEEIIGLANNNEIAVFLDYDGTLSPIVNDPEKAYMSSEMRQVLKAIAENFKTSIVSGRAREKVFEFVQIDTINYAGSHGTDIKMASTTWGEITEEHDSYQPAKKFATVMNQVYNSLVRETGHINGAKVENNTYCVSVHYRNVAKEDQLRVLHVVQEVLKNLNSGLDLTYGHMVYEIRPPLAFNKGNAVAYILDKLGLDFSIYIGDDLTDEDAFKVIRDRKKGIRILVSNTSRETSAFYSLKDPPQVMEFLKLLLSWKLKKIK